MLVVIFLSLAGCSSQKILSGFADGFVHQCRGVTTCVVDASKVTDFSWDEAFVFDASASSETIESKIRMPYPFYRDLTQKILFIKHGSIVAHEDYDYDPDDKHPSVVAFDFDSPPKTGYFHLDRERRKLRVQVVEIKGQRRYFVRPLENLP
ncbi:hypothetical protein FIV34_09860 [Luteibacter pinisoli]|uniref:Uncharacterized protein n=1 Tax=Luteibacter pinisoli TaxID=2589080 RepID=A0A4Y5Z4M7_9GAMM|nr:hypothetical protein [Luteibacter pinisoli]QDE39485.1 hypothetical protein FIV34_09860 [Luteibacter pinisoli]